MNKRTIAALLAFCIGCGTVTAIQAFAEPQAGVITFGDVTADGRLDAGDSAIILQAAASLGAGSSSSLTDEELAAADIDRDGEVTATDAALLLGYAAAAGAGYDGGLEAYLAENSGDDAVEAVFLGVSNWGKSGTTFANAGSFTYRFLVDGSEQLYTVNNTTEGDMPYPIQNLLKVNYRFRIRTDGNEIISVQEIEDALPEYTPPISGQPGERTLRNLLTTAMEPVGTTLYMFGGGWNWQDDGSGWSTRKIGVQPDWVRFWQEHDQSYTYRTNTHTTTYYPYGGFNQYHYAGLDCSGFVSWAVYNTLHDEDDLPGYGGKSTQMAKRFAGYGWGTWTHSVTTSTVMKPGDIMSMNGHVWLSLGTCADGSIVIAHSTPSNSLSGQPGGGVQIGAVGNSTSCEAYQLASKYMNQFYPDWCARYKVTLKSKSEYLAASVADAGRFTWNCTDPLTDPDGIQNMSAAQVLALLFGE